MKAIGRYLHTLIPICLWAVLFTGLAQSQQPAGPAHAYPMHAPGNTQYAHPPNSQVPNNLQNLEQSSAAGMHSMLAPYWNRTIESRRELRQAVPGKSGEVIPPDFSPWWELPTLSPTQPSSVPVGVDDLIQAALAHSPNVRAISIEPGIRDSFLFEEGAAFDWRTFLETGYNDKNDPVGNQLTTGNDEDRLKDRNWYANGGVRRTNEQGGEVELAQRLGAQRNNTRFLDPNPQGTARLELNYTHPLMNGSGRYYNRSRIVLAEIDSQRSRDEVTRLLQDHLLQVTEAYWDLYRARSRYVQRVTLYQAAEQVLQQLSGREGVDVVQRQVLRAKAAVAQRRSEIARAATQIENAESQLRVLVNDPILNQTAELTPLVSPMLAKVDVSMSDSLATALVHQPEITQAIRTLDATSIRLGVARNELLPKLDLVMSTYVAGLEGGTNSLSAWRNQFADGRPGFSVGLLWELPKGNRAARAREERRRLELQQASAHFENTVETSLTVVEVAVREVDTSYREMVGKYQAVLAATDETAYLSDRYALLPGSNDSATLLLEDLLDSQERQADEEAAFVDSQISYSLSLVQLRKAMGTLLLTDSIDRQLNAVPARRPMTQVAQSRNTQVHSVSVVTHEPPPNTSTHPVVESQLSFPPASPPATSWEELNLPTVPIPKANPGPIWRPRTPNLAPDSTSAQTDAMQIAQPVIAALDSSAATNEVWQPVTPNRF